MKDKQDLSNLTLKEIKLKDFSKETKELFKKLPRINKQYKGSLKQQVRQYIKDLNNER